MIIKKLDAKEWLLASLVVVLIAVTSYVLIGARNNTGRTGSVTVAMFSKADNDRKDANQFSASEDMQITAQYTEMATNQIRYTIKQDDKVVEANSYPINGNGFVNIYPQTDLSAGKYTIDFDINQGLLTSKKFVIKS